MELTALSSECPLALGQVLPLPLETFFCIWRLQL